MMRYFLGVDIGGSKSHALVADQGGRALGFGLGGPGNYEVVGWEGLRHTLQAVTVQALDSAGIGRQRIAGAGFGIAGYDWPGERQPTLQAIGSLSLSAPYALVNDAIIGLLAGAAEGWGVAVIAGTSNNCRGRDREGREGRVTGQGPPFAEYGGASELVAKAVQAVSLAWSQRGPATRLTDAFVELTGASSPTDLLEGLTLSRYALSADAAPLVFRLAAGGDDVALSLIRWAGSELGSLAVGVIRQLGFEDQAFDIVLVGSLYDGSPVLVETMQTTIQAIAPGARLVRLVAPPVIGGVLLGMEQAGMDATEPRETLIESTAALLSNSEALTW